MSPETVRERRRRLTHRALPLGAIAVVAMGAGLAIGGATESGAERAARSFGRAWERSDYRSMHALLTDGAARSYKLEAFRSAYEEAAMTATAEKVVVGDPADEGGDLIALPIRIQTRAFGSIRGELRAPVSDERIDWRPRLVFPGLRDTERLTRKTTVPPRARILSADGKTIAAGDGTERSSPEEVADSIAGSVEPSQSATERRDLIARGFPEDTPVGANGLERALQRKVEGRPGGTLSAGGRVLARSTPRAAKPVRSTIDTRLQEASDAALAERFGGIAVHDPKTAEIRALSGVAFSAPQPPGSTFKIVTTAAALEAKLVTERQRFPVVSEATIDGVPLENANGEQCGGTFAEGFAHSCNSVFAPLGVKVGAKRLVKAAERFGWNEPGPVAGAESSTLPTASEIEGPLEVGSSAIGQGRVLATPLQMASVAQTIANHGVRVQPSLAAGERPLRERVVSTGVAREIGKLMEGVVRYGTGTSAAIPGVRVAGKTGTAELEDTRGPTAENDDTALSDPSNTDAWFTSYAPARDPRVVVAVLLVRSGAGGATAAPVAQQVLTEGVKERK